MTESITSSPEHEYAAPVFTEEQKAWVKYKVLQIFDCGEVSIESPCKAPLVLNFEKFCRNIQLDFSRVVLERETFFGADLNPLTGEIEVTEITDGTIDEVFNKRNHLINIHTEPSHHKEYKAQFQKLLAQIPDPHFIDVEDFINDENTICEVILRVISPQEMGVIVLLKTNSHFSDSSQVKISSGKYVYEADNMKEAIENEKVLIKYNNVAVYRGFVFTPPVAGQSFLRLRRI